MNSTATNKGGWPATTMRTFVNSDIYNAIPTDLRNVIINTTVVSGHGTAESTTFTSTDKLYLLSTAEVWENGDSYDNGRTLTRQLDYYKSKNTTSDNYSPAAKNNGSSSAYWWLRTPLSWGTYDFYTVACSNAGIWSDENANFSYGVSPAFRIG